MLLLNKVDSSVLSVVTFRHFTVSSITQMVFVGIVAAGGREHPMYVIVASKDAHYSFLAESTPVTRIS